MCAGDAKADVMAVSLATSVARVLWSVTTPPTKNPQTSLRSKRILLFLTLPLLHLLCCQPMRWG